MMRCPLDGTFHVHRGFVPGTYAVIDPDTNLVAASPSWPTARRIAHLLELHGLVAVDLDQMPPLDTPLPPPTGMPAANPIEPTEAMRRHPSTYEGGDQ